METLIRKIDKNKIDEKVIAEAGKFLREGKLVAFPTETVYGLGADALKEEAARKTYAAKGRPSDNPLIVHIADYEDLKKIAVNIPPETDMLAAHFWPGPLTMIFEKSDIVPYGTTGGLDTVAVRMPADPVARALIRAAGGFVSAPSANTSGRPSPTTAQHVEEDLNGKIDMILDGGTVDIGLESTILDMTVIPPMILRPGAITTEMFEEVIGPVGVDETLLSDKSTQAPKAPGMKYKHYAPSAQVLIVNKDNWNSALQWANENKNQVGILADDEVLSKALENKTYSLGENVESAAKNLFAGLRYFDDDNQIKYILAEAFPEEGVGLAYMNRLKKSAGNQFYNK